MITRDLIERNICEYFGEQMQTVQLDGAVQVALPISDLHGDLITLSIEEGDPVVVTDAGALHHELGSLASAKGRDTLWERIRNAAHMQGLEFSDGELWTEVRQDRDLGGALIKVALTVRDVLGAETSRVPAVQVRFQEEVQLFLEDHNVPFTPNPTLEGASGVPHKVDFILQNGDMYVAQAVASELSMRRSAMIFYDLLETSTVFKPIAFVDPEQPRYSNETFQQLAFKAKIVDWNERDEFLEFWHHLHR